MTEHTLPTKTAIVLISGGLDSATCLAIAKDQGFEIIALSFDYGQKNRAELEAATRIAKQFQAKKHIVFPLALGEFGGSALTDQDIDVPDYLGDNKIPTTYVPARNTIFLSIALGLAEIHHATSIFTGMCAIDYSGYPDCRPEYIEAYQQMANLALKCGIEGNPITIETPLLHLSKAQTIKKGLALGVDYSQTVTCYQASPDGQACGTCDSCFLRKKGFKEAKVADPTRYST